MKVSREERLRGQRQRTLSLTAKQEEGTGHSIRFLSPSKSHGTVQRRTQWDAECRWGLCPEDTHEAEKGLIFSMWRPARLPTFALEEDCLY